MSRSQEIKDLEQMINFPGTTWENNSVISVTGNSRPAIGLITSSVVKKIRKLGIDMRV